MKQYKQLVKHVLSNGTRKENRTGVDTISTFGYYYEHDLREGFPLLTTKEVSWKNIVVEMLWFLSGSTDISILKRHKCRFWDAWADPVTGKVPSAYGRYWTAFPTFNESTGQPELNNQVAWVVDELKRNPMSRRMVVSAWDPGNAQTSKLPPCHSIWMLNVQNEYPKPAERRVRAVDVDGDEVSLTERQANEVRDELAKGNTQVYTQIGWDEDNVRYITHVDPPLPPPGPPPAPTQRLCLSLLQRSADIALGIPYNIASYALLMHLLSRFSGIPVGIFGHTLVDAHIYTAKPDGSMAEYDHVPMLVEQVTRVLRPLPRLVLSDQIQSLADVERLMGPDVTTEEVMKHFALEGYNPHPPLKAKVAV